MSGTVVVRGTGTVEVEPDAAVLVAEARSRAADPTAAHSGAAAVAAAVDDLLDRAGAAIRRRSTTALLVTPTYEWRNDGRQFVGYDAVRSSTIEIVDPAAIGDIFAGLAAVRANAGALTWIVDRENPAHEQARRLAAGDARARATSYVEALGLTLGPVLDVREPITKDTNPSPVAREMVMAKSAMADDGGGMAVEAPQLRVSAEVEVTFSLVP